MLPGQETLVACWAALASISPGAEVVRSRTSVAAIFPVWEPLNNAIAIDPLRAEARVDGDLSQLASAYAAAGVGAWSYWIPRSAGTFDAADETRVPGLVRDTTTLVMTAAISHGFRPQAGVVRTSVSSASRAGDVAVPVAELERPDRVRGLDAWVMVEDGMAVCGAWTFLHGSDCGVYGVGTVPNWRRRGLAHRLVEHVLAAAVQRGARTASLQSTAIAERLYSSLGFVPLGRYEEWLSG
jgi:GNAT superfamily N-acetyltransferase